MRVLVTGGTRGIGLATVRLFAGLDGCQLVVLANDFTDFPLQGENVQRDNFDLSQIDAIPKKVHEIGAIDVLVNNAGIYNGRPFSAYTTEDALRIHTVNYLAPMKLATEFVSQFPSSSPSRIINVTSVVAEIGGLDCPYTASKAALQNGTRALARQWGRLEICVNAVAPGIVEGTDVFNAIPAEVKQRLLAQTMDGKFATPDQVASVIFWLATGAPPSIKGATISINNGSHVS
ncbi:MAG TPA: SDR family oxidoreductase [Patescibacteria group bacterium]